MSTYKYTILDATGQPHSGTSEASSDKVLRTRLTEQGFTVKEIQLFKKDKKAGCALMLVALVVAACGAAYKLLT